MSTPHSIPAVPLTAGMSAGALANPPPVKAPVAPSHRSAWREIAGYEGLYSVSDAGQVFSHRTNRILSPRENTLHGVRMGTIKGFPKRIPQHHRDEIRRRYRAGGITQRALGAEYGVTKGAVAFILAEDAT